MLAPELSPRNTVVPDNLGSHKSEAVRHVIRKTGARLLFLPSYSPDLNPIEQAFAQLKQEHRHLLLPLAGKPAAARFALRPTAGDRVVYGHLKLRLLNDSKTS